MRTSAMQARPYVSAQLANPVFGASCLLTRRIPRSIKTYAASQLKPEETISLQGYLNSNAPTSDAAIAVLKKAVRKEVEPSLVEGALLFLEQTTDVVVDQLTDRWQMLFTTAGGFPRLQYLPVKEYFCVDDEKELLEIVTEFGFMTTTFSGSCVWGTEKVMATYSITRATVQFAFGAKFSFPFKLNSSLRMFFNDQQLACARSKVGGLILFVRSDVP